jgi:fumarate hydratase subunit beta
MSPEARELHQKYQAVYLAAVGGVAALFGSQVTSVELLAWEDLGPEAVRRVRLQGLPAVVAIDARGTDHLAAQYRTHGQRGA